MLGIKPWELSKLSARDRDAFLFINQAENDKILKQAKRKSNLKNF
jgi:hypothetical protein